MHKVLFIAIHLALFLHKIEMVPRLRVPLKDGYESRFVFNLEQFDAASELACTGELYVKNLTNKLEFKFQRVDVHKNINLSKQVVKKAVAEPITMKIGVRKIYDPDDYNTWSWVDPRFVLKVIKYTNIDDKGKVIEKGWEQGDLECLPLTQILEDDGEMIKMEINYNLMECIDPMENEVVEAHYRIITLAIDKVNQQATHIEYEYQKKNQDYEVQNHAVIEFKELLKY